MADSSNHRVQHFPYNQKVEQFHRKRKEKIELYCILMPWRDIQHLQFYFDYSENSMLSVG